MNVLPRRYFAVPLLLSLLAATTARAEVRVVVDHRENDDATPGFRFPHVPPPTPAPNQAAARATVTVLSGQADENGGGLRRLTDGRLPTEADQPAANFFFAAGTDGGRIEFDFGRAIEIRQVNTYSWHPAERAPQVYRLYAATGAEAGFTARPAAEADPAKAGWQLLARVAARSGGGQYGVSITDTAGPLGQFRYLLFACSATEMDDAFGNTFYSEIDIVPGAGGSNAAPAVAETPAYVPLVTNAPDGSCRITIDTSAAPDLSAWAAEKLAPVLAEWYPKLAAMLPSEGYTPPTNFTIRIAPGNGVAATGGTRVTANSDWLRRELQREAIGALLHEEIHVIQQYGRARRIAGATRAPGWLTEAIPDYIRWFLYEPASHGADLEWVRRQRNFNPKYDQAYRPGANFLNWASEKYDRHLVTKLNDAIRSGKYSEKVWQDATGKTADELGAEWKDYILQALGRTVPAGTNAPPAATNAPATPAK